MSQQTLNGRFRSASVALVPGQINLLDSTSGPATSAVWSQGASLVDPITTPPVLGQVWDIVSWSISFNGMLLISVGFGPPFGRLGKVVGGLTIGTVAATLTQTPSVRPWVNPALPLPSGIQNFSTLWDGDSDPPFPQVAAGASSLPSAVPITFTNQLPQPITVQGGESLGMVLTLTPSLATTISQIAVWNAQYVVTYERRRGSA